VPRRRHNEENSTTQEGLVSLIGAGPGDPELLTLRAVRRLERADIVLYDALVNPEMLEFSKVAQRCYVGKRAGQPSIRQDTIIHLMVKAAREGKRVVRLKGGDPFVLGRGGEEALALAQQNIPCEVVPGISSAIAAATAAQIPVTHRGLSSGFVVISGHDEARVKQLVAGFKPEELTLVVLMGLNTRGTLAKALLAKGWRGDCSAAIIFSAWRDNSYTHLTTVAQLDDPLPPEAPAHSPGTVIIGSVVDVSQQLQCKKKVAEHLARRTA
jgi:uroporphyrin-III C-methyltransferase